MKKILLFIAAFIIVVSSVKSLSYQQYVTSCEQLDYQQINIQINELIKFEKKIKEALCSRAPNYVYESYVHEQTNWEIERNRQLLKAQQDKDKETMCQIGFLEYLRVGVVLENYQEYLYDIQTLP